MEGKGEKILIKRRKRVKILNTEIDNLTMEETIILIEQYVINKEPLHLMGVNADKINMLNQNEELRRIVNNSGIVNADGASVILASRYLGTPLPERIAGIDLMQRLLEICEKKEYSIYLLGAKQEIVEKTAQILKRKYQKLKISGIHNGYFTQKEWAKIENELIKKKPDFVFVGITSPKKEYLIDYLQKKGLSCVFMGVGGSFDVISGVIPRAPIWMQKMNLEWFFRVLQEPRRLFVRYFIGNWKFIISIFREKKKND